MQSSQPQANISKDAATAKATSAITAAGGGSSAASVVLDLVEDDDDVEGLSEGLSEGLMSVAALDILGWVWWGGGPFGGVACIDK